MIRARLKNKSYLIQLLLNIIFGPLGLFYSSKVTALILSIICIVTLPAFGLGFFLCWPASVFLGYMFVKEHNALTDSINSLKNGEKAAGL